MVSQETHEEPWIQHVLARSRETHSTAVSRQITIIYPDRVLIIVLSVCLLRNIIIAQPVVELCAFLGQPVSITEIVLQ